MPDTDAVIEGSAPEIVEPAEVVAEPATAPKVIESEEKPEEEPETTVKTGSEPVDKPLGEKGAKELITTRKRAQEAEREAAYLKGKVDALTALTAGKTEEKSPATVTDNYHVAKPVQGENELYDDYMIRIYDWTADRREWSKQEKVKQDKIQQVNTEIAKNVESQKAAGEQKYRDFEDTVSGVELPNTMLSEIYESDIGHELIYHLGKNQKELERISALTPKQQIKEMARLEDKLRAGAITKPKTEAPEPPPTVRAGSTGNDDSRYVDPNTSTSERIRMSQARKMAAMQAQNRR